MSDPTPSKVVRTAVALVIGRTPLDNEIGIRPPAPQESNRLHEVHIEGKHLIAKEYLRADRPEAPLHEYAARQTSYLRSRCS